MVKPMEYEYIEICRRHVEEKCRDRVNAMIKDNDENQEIKQRYFHALIEHEANKLAFPVWMGSQPDLEEISSQVRFENQLLKL